jgi:hypothetical protein
VLTSRAIRAAHCLTSIQVSCSLVLFLGVCFLEIQEPIMCEESFICVLYDVGYPSSLTNKCMFSYFLISISINGLSPSKFRIQKNTQKITHCLLKSVVLL